MLEFEISKSGHLLLPRVGDQVLGSIYDPIDEAKVWFEKKVLQQLEKSAPIYVLGVGLGLHLTYMRQMGFTKVRGIELYQPLRDWHLKSGFDCLADDKNFEDMSYPRAVDFVPGQVRTLREEYRQLKYRIHRRVWSTEHRGQFDTRYLNQHAVKDGQTIGLSSLNESEMAVQVLKELVR